MKDKTVLYGVTNRKQAERIALDTLLVNKKSKITVSFFDAEENYKKTTFTQKRGDV